MSNSVNASPVSGAPETSAAHTAKYLVVINGPSLNMLGIREPAIYGTRTYDDLCEMIREHAKRLGAQVDIFQSNSEGAIIDRIQQAHFDHADGIVLNPAGYTHTSVAIRDALAAVAVPAVEVHVSNVDAREDFRRVNYVRDVCVATVSGEGLEGYLKAMDALCR